MTWPENSDTERAREWLVNYHGSIDSTALMLAHTAGQRIARAADVDWKATAEALQREVTRLTKRSPLDAAREECSEIRNEAWIELSGYVDEAESDGEPLEAAELRTYMRELERRWIAPLLPLLSATTPKDEGDD